MQVQVQTFKRRRPMEKTLTNLLNDGWALAAQSGTFSNNPMTMLFSGSSVTCTLTKNGGTQ